MILSVFLRDLYTFTKYFLNKPNIVLVICTIIIFTKNCYGQFIDFVKFLLKSMLTFSCISLHLLYSVSLIQTGLFAQCNKTFA